MTDYTQIDTDLLTLEDALSDEEWGKSPWDYLQFVALDVGTLEGFNDFTDEELAQTMRAIAQYAATGAVPDYSGMCSTAVKITVRTLVRSHDARMNAEYLKHYKQYVSVMRKKQTKQNDT